jgi:hypothetical protein
VSLNLTAAIVGDLALISKRRPFWCWDWFSSWPVFELSLGSVSSPLVEHADTAMLGGLALMVGCRSTLDLCPRNTLSEMGNAGPKCSLKDIEAEDLGRPSITLS